MCKISADSEDSSQIFLENSYISAKCLEIMYRYFTDRRKPPADNYIAVTYMLQTFNLYVSLVRVLKGTTILYEASRLTVLCQMF